MLPVAGRAPRVEHERRARRQRVALGRAERAAGDDLVERVAARRSRAGRSCSPRSQAPSAGVRYICRRYDSDAAGTDCPSGTGFSGSRRMCAVASGSSAEACLAALSIPRASVSPLLTASTCGGSDGDVAQLLGAQVADEQEREHHRARHGDGDRAGRRAGPVPVARRVAHREPQRERHPRGRGGQAGDRGRREHDEPGDEQQRSADDHRHGTAGRRRREVGARPGGGLELARVGGEVVGQQPVAGQREQHPGGHQHERRPSPCAGAPTRLVRKRSASASTGRIRPAPTAGMTAAARPESRPISAAPAIS